MAVLFGFDRIEKRRTMKAPVGANAARSGNKWSPGLKHGPARVLSITAFTPHHIITRVAMGKARYVPRT
jgi:hypothetical protein